MAMTLLGGCSEDGTDNRELDYGHVQFKLYKEASYEKRRWRAVRYKRSWTTCRTRRK